MERVAVIDIGSNSIKATVFVISDRSEAARSTESVRIFPALGDDGIAPDRLQLAAEAVARMHAFALANGARRTVIVGTSAMRESRSSAQLVRAVRDATGLMVNVLSGESEARVVARGVRSDPAYASYPDLLAFDLGGGSLEVVQLRDGSILRARSLPLGSVRLTNGFLGGGQAPLSDLDAASINSHVASMAEILLRPNMAETHLVLGAGGVFSAIASHLEAIGEPIQAGRIPTLRIRGLRDRLCKLDVDGRRNVPGIPPDRADIMPAALVTVCTLAELCGAEAFHLTHHGVRHGMLDVMLTNEGVLL